MTVDKFIKICEEYNYTFLLSNTYCWGLKLKHSNQDSEYAWYEKMGDRDLQKLLECGVKYIKNRRLCHKSY